MKITESIHALRHSFRLALGGDHYVDRFVYSYLIAGKTICLVDTGVFATAPLILDYVRGLGRKPEEISMILLTHAHPDHIGGCAPIKKSAPALVAIHPAEKHWVEDIEKQYRERPIPNLFDLVRESVPADLELIDGETVPWEEGKTIRIIDTPGHSPGSVSFFFEEEGALFSGDSVPSAGTIPIYVDPVASVASVQKLKKLSNVQYLLSSWHEPIAGKRIEEAMDEGYGYIMKIDAIVEDIHRKGPLLSLEVLSLLALERLGLKVPKVLFMVETTFRGHLDRLKGVKGS
ncbi:MAG: MBL fold metallo-hydrolase [Syntrophus sp. (in: bacteria)]|nr:MBL fold metallo-hydrolase [Syntrophus sp. (in: bacteria)]